MIITRRLGAAALAISGYLMAGCGSGGSSTTAPAAAVASTSSFAIDAAVKHLSSTSRTTPFTLSGSINGVSVSGSGTLVESARLNGSLNGQATQYQSSVVSMTVTAQGQSSNLSITAINYFDNNDIDIAATGSSVPVTAIPSTYSTNVTVAVLPKAAKVGDSGNWVTQNVYSDVTKFVQTGSHVRTWKLTADTANTALLTINSVSTPRSGAAPTSTTAVYQVTPSGVTKWVSGGLPTGGNTLIFTYQ